MTHVLPRCLLNYSPPPPLPATTVPPPVPLLAGLSGFIITAGQLQETVDTVPLVAEINACLPAGSSGRSRVYTTLGTHPTRANGIGDLKEYSSTFTRLASEHARTAANPSGAVVCYGELGLDYDRLQFSSKQEQVDCLSLQLSLIASLRAARGIALPLFLHSRNCGDDLYDHLRASDIPSHHPLVVHSFDGPVPLMEKYLSLSSSTFIGFNGCSLRTADNLLAAAACPLDRILVETDSPYCDIRATHASHPHVKTVLDTCKDKKYDGRVVKGRNEPCAVTQVMEVMESVRGEALGEAVKGNVERCFFGGGGLSSLETDL